MCCPDYICLLASSLLLCLLMITLVGCPLYRCRLSLSLPLHPSCPVLPTYSQYVAPHETDTRCWPSKISFSPAHQLISTAWVCFKGKPEYSWALVALIHNRCSSWHFFMSKKPLNVSVRDSSSLDFSPSAWWLISEGWVASWWDLEQQTQQ